MRNPAFRASQDFGQILFCLPIRPAKRQKAARQAAFFAVVAD
jgi:hypothetical protein